MLNHSKKTKNLFVWEIPTFFELLFKLCVIRKSSWQSFVCQLDFASKLISRKEFEIYNSFNLYEKMCSMFDRVYPEHPVNMAEMPEISVGLDAI